MSAAVNAMRSTAWPVSYVARMFDKLTGPAVSPMRDTASSRIETQSSRSSKDLHPLTVTFPLGFIFAVPWDVRRRANLGLRFDSTSTLDSSSSMSTLPLRVRRANTFSTCTSIVIPPDRGGP